MILHESMCFDALKECTDVIIADITAGQKNHFSTEITPRTLYPLYGILKNASSMVIHEICKLA